MIEAEVGVPAPIALMLPDGAASKGVRAYLQTDTGTALTDFPLVHQSRGRYAGSFAFPAAGIVYVDFVTFEDVTFAVEDLLYTRRTEIYRVSPVAANLTTAIAQIPQNVWAFPTRLFTNDLSALATHSDAAALATLIGATAKTQYLNRMTTTFNSITGDQEVLVWPEKDGAIVAGTNCLVAVKDSTGALKWNGSMSTPNADGVFRFINPISVQPAQNLYIVTMILVDGQPRTNIQPFFTVG